MTIATVYWSNEKIEAPKTDISQKEIYYICLIDSTEEPDNTEPIEESIPPDSTAEVTESYQYTEEDITLMARLTQAEAGNQSELGKRLVIDTVLNRRDHPNFPDTIRDVIYQKNQFSPVTTGAIDLYTASEENIKLVKEEIERRTDQDVIYFRASRYSDYGVPMYCVGDHYFSSYD